jgi:two-component system chemotaxis response regulator CheB
VGVEDHVEEPEPAAADAVEIIVIGASAGGLHPLRAIVSDLPPDLPASVLVVTHVAATGTSFLPQILGRAADIEVVAAADGQRLRPGLVVVAVPDQHLVVEDGTVRLTRGPRENGHRPAIDPLLRTVADAYGPRAAGVILSGTRDDGTQGLAALKRQGGFAIVQDPAEAEYPGMPQNAIEGTAVDAVLAADAIAALLVDVTHGRAHNGASRPAPVVLPGPAPLVITCPDCGGVLTETDDAGVAHFRCHVGHAFSPRSLLALHADGVERAMWTAARSLKDRGMLLHRLAERARGAGNIRSAEQFAASADRALSESDAVLRAIDALDDSYVADAPSGADAA